MKKFNKYYLLWAALVAVYAALVWITPANETAPLLKYSLSASQAKLIGLTFMVPIALIWLVAFYGLVAFKKYAKNLSEGTDSRPMSRLSAGLHVLVLSLPAATIVNSVSTYLVRQRPGLLPVSTIISNYIILGLVLLAFWLLYRGSQALVGSLKKPAVSARHKLLYSGFLIFCGLYAWVTLSNPERQFAASAGSRAAYYLPDVLLILTIVLPYIFVWFFGINTAYNISLYALRVKGIIYRQGLRTVALGLTGVVLSSTAMRFLASLSSLLSNLSLRVLLMVVYILLTALAIGYILIAVGAKKLRKIEEA